MSYVYTYACVRKSAPMPLRAVPRIAIARFGGPCAAC